MTIRYFIPRFILLICLALASWFVRDELVRCFLPLLIASKSNLSMQIGLVQTNILRGHLILNDVVMTDPQKNGNKIAQFDKIILCAENRDILLRYLHFQNLEIDGISIVIDEQDENGLIKHPFWNTVQLGNTQPIFAGDLATILLQKENPDQISQQILQKLPQNLLQNLETSKLVDELDRRWQLDISQLDQTAKKIKGRLQSLQQVVDESKRTNNHAMLIDTIFREIGQMEADIKLFQSTLTSLQMKSQQDHQSILKAMQQDQIVAKSLAQKSLSALSNPVQSLINQEMQSRGEAFLGTCEQMTQLIAPLESHSWTDLVQTFSKIKLPENQAGEMIHLAQIDARPEILIDSTKMTGTIFFGESPLYFTGRIENFAFPMPLGPAPVKSFFCFSSLGIPAFCTLNEKSEQAGKRSQEAIPISNLVELGTIPEIFVEWESDRRGNVNQDRFVFSCQSLQLPERLLGNPSNWAIRISSSPASFIGELHVDDDKIRCDLTLKQQNVQLKIVAPPEKNLEQFVATLQHSLDSIASLEIKMTILGNRILQNSKINEFGIAAKNENRLHDYKLQYSISSNLDTTFVNFAESLPQSLLDSLTQSQNEQIRSEANRGIMMLNSMLQERLAPMATELTGERNLWEQLLQQQNLGQISDKLPISIDPKMGSKIEEQIQHGVDKLQEKLPGILDQLRGR
ncbi:MAG: hypothetical protein ACRCUY_05160 [Thermoguttaceae bacterium]